MMAAWCTYITEFSAMSLCARDGYSMGVGSEGGGGGNRILDFENVPFKVVVIPQTTRP